ncbi:MAG TPA: glycoside hydrolase family 3 C-terminal domain-containing protein [Acidobacteriaceae bacterium]|nr:glycoside hydrolase family 3 C-terminal domain-containing protein [Acidobacteriaceae bacterium]
MVSSFGRPALGANPPQSADTRAQPKAITGNPRVDKLLSEMTFAEKVAMLHGSDENPATFQGQAGYLAGVPRLGIPSMRFADGPPGVLTRVPSTALTATMGLAATFSREDARRNGVVIARDARSLGIDVVLQPFINMDRDLTFERAYNTFGEDPLLSGDMAAAEIEGIQNQGIMAQAKHFVGYDGGTDVFIGPQALHEIYVAPFAAAVRAGVSSIMCSYNKINGAYACNNPDTLITILRDQVGFRGFVTSDWGANHTPDFVKDGTDLEMPGPIAKNFEQTLHNAVASGTESEAAIDRAVGRILCQMDRFGLLDGKSKHTITPIDTAADAPVVEKTGEDAAVLLRNSDRALPLTQDDLQSLALIGPGAGQTMAIGIPDEKAVGIPARQIGPLSALQKLTAGDSLVHLRYAVADDMTGTPIPAEFFMHDGQPGLERAARQHAPTADIAPQIDKQINFAASSGHALPANSAYTWTGVLNVPTAGSYWLYLQNLGCFASLTLDGKKLASNEEMVGHGIVTQAGQDNVLPTTDGLDDLRVKIQLTAGNHPVVVSIQPDSSNRPTQVRLSWVTPEQQQANHDAAVAAAKSSRMAIVFAWSADNPAFQLPDNQDQLIADVAAVNPNTVVVLNASQPVAVPWLSKVKGVLLMWFPGDEGGWATANLLLGKASPAGRLPFTWPQRLEQGLANDPSHPERVSHAKEGEGKTTYSEGIFMGYRWYDQQKLQPLFPFGYGLSYTHFAYSHLHVAHADDGGLDVRFDLRNIGAVAGDEVPQVYLDAPQRLPRDKAQFAVHALAAFDRIHLAAGENREVSLHVPLRSLQYWSASANKWMLAAGPRTVRVGASSRDLRLAQKTTISPLAGAR